MPMNHSDDDAESLAGTNDTPPNSKRIRYDSSEDDISEDEECDAEGNVDEIKLVEQVLDRADETYVRPRLLLTL